MPSSRIMGSDGTAVELMACKSIVRLWTRKRYLDLVADLRALSRWISAGDSVDRRDDDEWFEWWGSLGEDGEGRVGEGAPGVEGYGLCGEREEGVAGGGVVEDRPSSSRWFLERGMNLRGRRSSCYF